MRQPNDEKGEKGAALLSALFIMSVCAILSFAIAISERFLLNNAELIVGYHELYQQASGIQYWAEAQIIQNQDLRKPLKQTVNGVTLTGTITPLNALFNINSLTNTQNYPYFFNLLKTVLPNLSSQTSLFLANNIHNWITAGWLMGANDDYYLNLKNPYRVPHRLMVSVSELRLVRGVSATIYAALAPWLTALPNSLLHIDINYASATVLSILAGNNPDMGKEIAACRNAEGFFQTTQSFINRCGMGVLQDSAMTIDENYFLVRAIAAKNHQRVVLNRMLLKGNGSGPNQMPRFTVAWQEINNES